MFIPKKEVILLYLAEMGFGTKAYDPLAMDGLVLFLKENGFNREIDGVVMQGALIPRVPEFYSVNNAEDMRFLGNDPTKEDREEISNLVMESDLPPEDKEYYQTYIARKIVNKQEALNAAKGEMDKLMGALKKGCEIHYQIGEEDRKNMQELKEIMINEITRSEENKVKLEDKIESLMRRQNELSTKRETIQKSVDIIQHVYRGYRRLSQGRSPEERKAYVESRFDEYVAQKKYDLRDKEIKELKTFISRRSQDVNRLLTEVLTELNSLKSEIDEIDGTTGEMQRAISAIDRVAAARGFFRATGRLQIESDEEELYFRLAKLDYYDKVLYRIAKPPLFNVHSTKRKTITLSYKGREEENNISLENGKKCVKEISATVTEIAGIKILLLHNPNETNSDYVYDSELARQKQELHFLNKIYNMYKGSDIELPDIVISAHGSGGFRHQLQTKERTGTIRDEYSQVPDNVMHIKLPSFQSMEKLRELHSKGLKNWHTKRYAKGLYASGAVIHHIREDGTHLLHYVDVSELIEYGKIASQIKNIRGNGRNGKNNVVKNKLIRELREKVRINEIEKINVDGDDHIGVANPPQILRSNYDIVDACHLYHMEAGIPKILIYSEGLQGTERRIFNHFDQYISITPKEREDLEERIMKSELKAKDKEVALRWLFKKIQEGIPLPNNSLARLEWARRNFDYMQELLVNNCKIVFVSGNHYNGSSLHHDEAVEFANMVDPTGEYKDKGQVIVFGGFGQKYGSGVFRISGGKSVYTAHKLDARTDEILGAMQQISHANIKADIVAFFDRHQGGGGFADGSAFIMGLGKQPWNEYVDEIGKQASVRGTMNLFHDPKKNGYVAWEYVPDKALEKYMRFPENKVRLFSEKRLTP